MSANIAEMKNRQMANRQLHKYAPPRLDLETLCAVMPWGPFLCWGVGSHATWGD
jgi:hypothetical protein